MNKATMCRALIATALCGGVVVAQAQTTDATKPAKTATKPTAATKAKAKPARKPAAPPPPPELVLPDASAEQLDAAERVLYGTSECEFKQNIDVSLDAKHAGYVDLTFNKVHYLMKPVLSSTGAMRLEDVRGQTLLVQISTKSMLLNTESGHRMVDECIHEKQRMAAAANAAAAAATSTTTTIP